MGHTNKIAINTLLIEEISLVDWYQHSPYIDYKIREEDEVETAFFGIIKETKRAGIYSWDAWTTDYKYKGTVDEVLKKLEHYYIKDGEFYIYPRIKIRFISGFEKTCYYDTFEEAQEAYDLYAEDMKEVKIFRNKS